MFLNPKLKINIATNGTVYNKQVRTILDKCNIHLNISIDSLDKENYESIRINGDFDELMDPDNDAPLNQITIRDLAAIMLKKPVSQKEWLNNLIKS